MAINAGEITVWNAVQALVRAYTSPESPESEAIVATILLELAHDSVLGELAQLAGQYWTGYCSSTQETPPRVLSMRLRQFGRCLDAIERLVWSDPPFFGGPEQAQDAG